MYYQNADSAVDNKDFTEASSYPSYPYVSLSALLLFCAYTVIWYLQVGMRISLLGTIRIEMLWAIGLICIAVFSGRLNSIRNPLVFNIVLYFVCLIISVILSIDIAFSWDVFFNRVIKFSIFGFFIAVFIRSPRDLKYFIITFLLVCAKMGQEGFIGKITGSMMWENQGVMRLHGSTPLYFHPNSFSGMALGTLPFILYMWKLSKSYLRYFLIILTIFSVNIILFTGSRTGYVAFLIMLFFYIFIHQKKVKYFFLVLLALLLAFIFTPEQYKERFMSSFSSYHKVDSSAGKRVQILRDAWDVFKNHPLGVGVAAFPIIRKQLFDREQDTHNLYLEVLTNIGIQGFIVFSLLIFQIFKLLFAICRDIDYQLSMLLNRESENFSKELQHHIYDLRLSRAVGHALILFIILRLALGLFGMDLYEIYWWFSIGLAIALYNINRTARLRTAYFDSISA